MSDTQETAAILGLILIVFGGMFLVVAVTAIYGPLWAGAALLGLGCAMLWWGAHND